MTISIRPPASMADYEAMEWLQSQIWGPIGVAPTHLLLTLYKEGGVLLLAVDEGEPVGFCYGFPALTEEGRLKMASHQTGVLPAYQDQGLGYKIKLAQREATLAKDIDLMTWTFDPLQGRNARFNLRKLGAVGTTYLRNLYGAMNDDLNRGMPSDRFRVDWWLASDHVARRLAGQIDEPDHSAWPLLNPAQRRPDGLPEPVATPAEPHADRCLVEIPADIVALREQDPDLARRWRFHTRQIFEAALGQGYSLTDLLRREGRNLYLLEKNWQVQLPRQRKGSV